MSHKIENQEFFELSRDAGEEQARTLLELVTEIYNALEREKRFLAQDQRLAAGSGGRPPYEGEGAP